MKDALGNDLVMGKKYGYASRSGSWVNTAVGVLENIGVEKATLHIIERHTFLYGKESDEPWTTGRTVSVQGCMLFPVKD